MFVCLSSALSFICGWLSGFQTEASDPIIGFSDKERARGVRVDKFTVSGQGQVLAEAPLLQTRAYFEAQILNTGKFAIGVSYQDIEREGHLGDGKTSWAILSEDLHSCIQAGDVVGCAYDTSDLWPRIMFYYNGNIVQNRELKAIRGDVFPAVSVSDGCVLELNFGQKEFLKDPPPRFEKVLPTRNIMNESA